MRVEKPPVDTVQKVRLEERLLLKAVLAELDDLDDPWADQSIPDERDRMKRTRKVVKVWMREGNVGLRGRRLRCSR